MDRHKLLGHLHEFWWWALDNVGPDGDLGDLTDEEIEAGAEWDGEQGAFVMALRSAGFIDGSEEGQRLHDWYDYAGKLLDRREQNAKRMREARAAPVNTTNDERATHVQDTCSARAPATVPNRTQPNHPLRGAVAPAPAAEAPKGEDRQFWSVMAKVHHFEPNARNRGARGSWNESIAVLRAAGAKPDEYPELLSLYCQIYPGGSQTPPAVAKYADQLVGILHGSVPMPEQPPARNGRRPQAPAAPLEYVK